MTLAITPLSEAERKHFSRFVIGKAVCPICAQNDINVVNDRGPQSDATFNYFENHRVNDNSSALCKGSEEMLVNFA